MIPDDASSVPDDVRDGFGKFFDGNICAAADIDPVRRIVHFDDVGNGISEVVDMEEFPSGRSRAPRADFRGVGEPGLVETADKRRHHMGVLRMVIVSGAEEVGGHCRVEEHTILLAVILTEFDPVGEAEGHGELHLVVGLVGPVPALPLGLPEHRLGEAVLPGQLPDIVLDAVLILEVGGLELAPHLVAEPEGDPGVDHRLALQHVQKIFHRDVDIGKDLQVGLPAEFGAGLFAGVGRLPEAADVLALFKVEGGEIDKELFKKLEN